MRFWDFRFSQAITCPVFKKKYLGAYSKAYCVQLWCLYEFWEAENALNLQSLTWELMNVAETRPCWHAALSRHCEDCPGHGPQGRSSVLGTVHGDGALQQLQASYCIRKYAHLISGIKGPAFILKVAITGCFMLEEKSFEILFFRGWKIVVVLLLYDKREKFCKISWTLFPKTPICLQLCHEQVTLSF